MIYVVPSLKAKEKLQSEGKAWAESQGFTYVLRHQRTIQDLMDEYGEDFLVYSSRGPQIDRPEGSHFFSLNMAELRIQNLRKGQRDHLLEALIGRGASHQPLSVLDCTCGFGGGDYFDYQVVNGEGYVCKLQWNHEEMQFTEIEKLLQNN